ncbi:MAG: hypothetical protein PHD43_23310 [Methylococcales bacterium]|nr:hypothetical protein [Candidatus Paceibacterota bacterium]MDD5323477.1 hypothetical protein [Methylococcales bacterium]
MTKQTRKELEENRTEWIIFIVICGMIIGSTFTMVLVALIGSDKFFSDAKDLQQENTQLREECELTDITANKNVTLKGYETQTSDRLGIVREIFKPWNVIAILTTILILLKWG